MLSTEIGSSFGKQKEKDNFPSLKEFLSKSRISTGHRTSRSSFTQGDIFKSGFQSQRMRTNSGYMDTPTGDFPSVRASMPNINFVKLQTQREEEVFKPAN